MNYQQIDNRIVAEDGRVAIQHYIANPTNIRVHGTSYVWTPKRNVSLAWVLPEHVDAVLRVKVSNSG